MVDPERFRRLWGAAERAEKLTAGAGWGNANCYRSGSGTGGVPLPAAAAGFAASAIPH